MAHGRQLIVVSDPNAVSGDRWTTFVEALKDELRVSGLGELVASRSSELREVAVSLAAPDYGRALVDRVVSNAGLPPRAALLPGRWEAFNCADYFESSLAVRGCADATGFIFVLPRQEVYEYDELGLLVIGSPGCDGIVWGYRRGRMGIWAWYPTDREFVPVAASVEDLVEGWTIGRISL
jgi:hypothetical protein